jgi:D-tyrosyl-tRNA(Tyr) deacylase
MIGLLQRVSSARVAISAQTVAEIESGILLLVGVVAEDTPANAHRLAERVLTYRIFADADEKMNLSVMDIQGDILAVPQFTLAADTRKGCRPGFSTAAPPEQGKALFLTFIEALRSQYQGTVEEGVFGAEMQVELTNEGPATFWLSS